MAKDVDLGIKAHQEFVQSVWDGHPMGGMMKFENFYASQCLWEDTMAESVANALAEKPGYRMVVIVGAGHVRERFGIPMRADKRGAAPSAVLCGEEFESGKLPALTEILAANLGDYLYFTEPAPETPPSPKLGVSLAQGEEAGKGEGLLVKEVTAGGAAAAAGVAAGDRIVGISGGPVATLEDLQIRLAIMDGVAGTVDVLRGTERKSLPFTTVKVAP